MAEVLLKKMLELRGLQSIVMLHQDVKFIGYLWNTLWKFFGTNPKFLFDFHL